ncbi:MAG TPA: hypothetical protein VNC16_05305 [Solirubrobacterales bacterium]|nr:hypothetical protein [Solirubrobacterales bacterium]
MAFIVAVSVLAAGCGNGDSETGAAEPQQSKAQFLQQANAICRQGLEEKERKLVAVVEKEGKSPLEGDSTQLEKLFISVVVPVYGDLISELTSLSPPTKDSARVERTWNEYEAALEEAEADPSKVVGENVFDSANEASAQYGMDACSL